MSHEVYVNLTLYFVLKDSTHLPGTYHNVFVIANVFQLRKL